MSPASSAAPAACTTSTKRRAPMSCDRCKSRKTKCVDPVPGPCQFCASINAVCHLDPSRRRQRPYYHVSEEEFRYMTKALEHFLPDAELNLHTLRELVQSFEAHPPAAAKARAPTAVANKAPAIYGNSSDAACSLASPSCTDSAIDNHDDRASPMVKPDESLVPSLSSPPPSARATAVSDVGSLEEIDEMHSSLAWLRVDAKGMYRHVGAESGYGFHAAVRSLHQRSGSEGTFQTDIMPPLTAAPTLPPPTRVLTEPVAVASLSGLSSNAVTTSKTSASRAAAARRTQILLPRRDLCNRCVSRFFRDTGSVYWFWSAERFFAELDRLYAGDPTTATPALLCSLYAMLALTCESEAAANATMLADEAPPPAARFLALAKTYVSALCDEVETDSVRALCLLALALQSAMSTNTAYIYIGAAARIALTLGLHLQRSFEPKGCLQRQVDLRLYATLFLLDMDVALCYGNPSAISDDLVAGKPMDLSEQILGPGSYMPLDYLTVSYELIRIRRYIVKLLYSHSTNTTSQGLFHIASATRSTSLRTSTPPTTSKVDGSPAPPSTEPLSSSSLSPPSSLASITAVHDILTTLRAWYDGIPSHLHDVSHAATFHQRSVSVLHLRYWSTTIFATRPFLLYSALHSDALATLPPVKRVAYSSFAATCADAARQALQVVELMRDKGMLSSLITFDTDCILEILQVFLLIRKVEPMLAEAAANNALRSEENVFTCLRALQGMGQFFWTRHALTEVTAQLEECGLLNGDHGFNPPAPGETPSNLFLDLQQQNLMPGVMEAYFTDLQDPFFSAPEDVASASLLTENFDECIAEHTGITI